MNNIATGIFPLVILRKRKTILWTWEQIGRHQGILNVPGFQEKEEYKDSQGKKEKESDEANQ